MHNEHECVYSEIGDGGEEFMWQSTDPKKSVPHPSGPQTWGIDYYMFGHILEGSAHVSTS